MFQVLTNTCVVDFHVAYEFKMELLNIEFYENNMKMSKKLNRLVFPCRVYDWNYSLSQLIKIHLLKVHYNNDTEIGMHQNMQTIKSNFFIILI